MLTGLKKIYSYFGMFDTGNISKKSTVSQIPCYLKQTHLRGMNRWFL